MNDTATDITRKSKPSNGRSHNWTDERIEHLKELWAEGYSCAQIAKRLGGVTRNAVIGKVHRMSLPKRKTVIRQKRIVPPKPRRKSIFKLDNIPLKPGEPLPEPSEIDPKPEDRIQLADLTQTTCRYPIENPGDPTFGFCGRQCHAVNPYCTEHMQVSYLLGGRE